MIFECTCVHTFQDEFYGKGKRYCNKTQRKEGVRHYYRCTVCGKEYLEKNKSPNE